MEPLAQAVKRRCPDVSEVHNTSVYKLLMYAGGEGHLHYPSVYALKLIELLEREPNPVCLLGWSMGGMVALEAARAVPEKIVKLVLVSTAARFTRSADFPCGVEPAKLQATLGGLSGDLRATLEFFFFALFRADAPREMIAHAVKHVIGLDVDLLMHGLEYLRQVDLREEVRQIDVPTLVIHGDQDRIIPFDCGRALVELLPAVSFERIPKGSHMIVGERSDEVADKIEEFLKA